MRPFFIFKRDEEEYHRQQIERGALAFTESTLALLAAIWGGCRLVGQDPIAATFQLPSGQNFRVGVDFIEAPQTIDHDFQRMAVEYVLTQWGGKAATITFDTDERLWARAYAEVYGVHLFDTADDNPAAPVLTKNDLARLPQMRAEIRAKHPDAPPAPPNEQAALAAAYRALYPFRVLAAA